MSSRFFGERPRISLDMSLEQINRNISQSGVELSSNKRGSFESRHKRITIYLENSTFLALQSIRNQGVSQSLVVNLALKEFIEKN